MNAQDFRSLQEAYMEVVMNELDEGYKPPAGKMAKRVAHKMFKGVNTLKKAKDAGETLDTAGGQVAGQKSDKLAKQAQKIYQTAKSHSKERSQAKERQNRAVGDTAREIGPISAASLRDRFKREEYNLYDIILSHLLDEGYAETPEAAERIMVNMSEEWRESIVETRMDPRGRPASGPMNVYANPKGKPSQARLDAIKAYDAEEKKKTPEQRAQELADYKERQMNR